MTKALRRDDIVRLYQAKMSPKDIAEKLGITLKNVYTVASQARDKGLLPRTKYTIRRTKAQAGMKLMQYHCRNAGKSAGSMVATINALTPATIRWLVEITPPGQPVALTIQSIIVDAYQEENAQ